MKPLLSRAILAFYPLRWRRRYGDEFVTLLGSLPPTPSNVVDAICAGLALRAPSLATALAIVSCAVVLTADGIRRPSPGAPVARSFSLPASTACRSYSSVNAAETIEGKRCLD